MFPFREMMGSSLCHLHWSPEQFWRATNHELQSANEAQARANKAAEQAAERPRGSK